VCMGVKAVRSGHRGRPPASIPQRAMLIGSSYRIWTATVVNVNIEPFQRTCGRELYVLLEDHAGVLFTGRHAANFGGPARWQRLSKVLTGLQGLGPRQPCNLTMWNWITLYPPAALVRLTNCAALAGCATSITEECCLSCCCWQGWWLA
jgi:hypothetical protein